MKFNKIFLVIFYISFFFSSAQSSQEIILNNLFNQLEKVNNSKASALLEENVLPCVLLIDSRAICTSLVSYRFHAKIEQV